MEGFLAQGTLDKLDQAVTVILWQTKLHMDPFWPGTNWNVTIN